MAKILCGGDPHCYYDNYSHQTAEGISSRLADWITTGRAMVDLAIQEQVDLVVFPGDLYPNARPSSQAQIAIANLFAAFEAAGIPVVACNGNHDVAGPGQPGPVDVLGTLGRPTWGITTPHVVTVEGVQVAVLPWAKPANLLFEASGAGDLAGRTSAALVAIVRGLAVQVDPAVPSVLIGHWAVAGCQTSSGMTISGGEPALPLGEIQAGPWRAVIMGHIHKPQVFPGRPVTLHTGAMQRVDFGEERDPRGCYIVDTETGEATWHDLPVRRFYTWYIPDQIIAGVGRGERYEFVPPCEDHPQDAICRVKYRIAADQAGSIDHGALIRALEDAGAAHVAGVYPEVIRSERARAAGVTEETSPLSALESWLDLQTLPLDLKADVRLRAQQLLEEVN